MKVCLLAYLNPTNEPKLSYFSATFPSLSESKGKGKEYFSANFLWLSVSSKLIPNTFALSLFIISILSLNSHASFVQPGVSSLG